MTQIICVSRGSLSRGKELAEALARKLGYALLSREDLIEAAIDDGIQVGKLETSMMHARAFTERLARERDHYLAFSTAYLCDKALAGPLVYHGRSGHLLLRGISHVLRVRVLADHEYRINAVMRELGLTRDKAERYLQAVEEDRRTWVRSMYGVPWESASQYDVTVSVERMTVENAAASLVGMTQLPDFQMTPASKRAMDDLRLAAQARLRLAKDPRTARAEFSVRAHDGALTVTYLPKDMDVANVVRPVLVGLAGVSEVSATVATSNILWVQESFDPAGETFDEVVEIARKWHAAVELVQFTAGDGPDAGTPIAASVSLDDPVVEAGIEEDTEPDVGDGAGLRQTLDALAEVGRSGGGRRVLGERAHLIASCCGPVQYSLVVLGNLFLAKPAATRTRLIRELQDRIGSRLHVPVVTADELRQHYLFGRRDAMRLVGFLAVLIGVYALVLSHQSDVVRFLYGGWTGGAFLRKLVIAAAVFAFIPLLAHAYGTVVRSMMKLVKMD
jgi:cytidylate kinase